MLGGDMRTPFIVVPSARAVARGVFVLCLALAGSALAVCGDNRIDGTERCDGTDLGGRTCADLTSGFAQGGIVSCNADCTYNATDCRRVFLESLIPALKGKRQNRCHIEWGTVGTSTVPRSPMQRVCSEGDPTCDQDKQFNNACTIRIQMCLNVPDPRISDCAPTRIVRMEVLKPTLATTEGRAAASAVLAAGQSAAPEKARISESGVSYGPPITDFRCGSNTVKIPLRGETGRARPGKMVIRARTSDNSGRVRAVGVLKLVCNP
jgi:hypothetical protein